MSRVAEAIERAGSLRAAEEVAWNRDLQAAQQILGNSLAVLDDAADVLAGRAAATPPQVAGGSLRGAQTPAPRMDSMQRAAHYEHGSGASFKHAAHGATAAALAVEPDVLVVAEPVMPPIAKERPRVGVRERTLSLATDQAEPHRNESSAHTADDELDPIRFELAKLVRHVFLAPGRSAAKSVLFCTAGEEPTGEVAWQTAELLATQSGKRVAFVEDGSRVPQETRTGHKLITRVGWYPPESDRENTTRAAAPTTAAAPAQPDALGEHVPDLFETFDFVVINARTPRPQDLVPLAQEVDGVILMVARNRTTRPAAQQLTDTLRASKAKLLGAVLTN